jgi:hypothetical protein
VDDLVESPFFFPDGYTRETIGLRHLEMVPSHCDARETEKWALESVRAVRDSVAAGYAASAGHCATHVSRFWVWK